MGSFPVCTRGELRCGNAAMAVNVTELVCKRKLQCYDPTDQLGQRGFEVCVTHKNGDGYV